MSNAHKKSELALSGKLIAVDDYTTFLAHYDITVNDVLGGAPPSSAIYSLRPFEGIFGGGVAIEEGTTNLSDATSYSYWDNSGTSTFSTNDTTVGVPFNGIPVMSLLKLTSGNSEFGLGTASVTGGGTYSVSIYAYFDTADNENGSFPTVREFYASSNAMKEPLIYYDANGVNHSTFSRIPKRQWLRLICDGHVTASGSQSLYVSTYLNQPTSKIYMTAPQIESKAFNTSFVSGNRANGNITYPNDGTLNPQEGCINIWVNVRTLPDYPWRMIFVCKDNGITDGTETNQIRFGFVTNSSTWHWKFEGNNGNAFYQTIAVTNGWHMFTCNWSLSQGFIKYYYDGNLEFTSTDTSCIPSEFYNSFWLGNWTGAGGDMSNNMIDELKIDCISRTDNEIKSWFVNNQPFYPKGLYRIAY